VASARPVPATTARRLRLEAASEVAARYGGVAHRSDLRAVGVDRHHVRVQVGAGRWATAGRHTVVVNGGEPAGEGRWWWAVWESGSGAVLDGVSALLAQGMAGFTAPAVHVTVPRQSTPHHQIGVVVHRRRFVGPVIGAGVPRVSPEWATIRAAQWAASDRQAALLVCLPVQQRLVLPARLMYAWAGVRRSPRRALLDAVIADVCDGAHSLGELDFARWCRRYRLPEPVRQSVRRGPDGRAYLDAAFANGLVVEIDGGQHLFGLAPLDDALRANEITLDASRVLRLPVLGLRLRPDEFMAQVARALGRQPLAVMPKALPATRQA